MGLSNYHKYRLSEHAIERFRERFDPSASENAISARVRGWLSQAVLLQKEDKKRETWFDEKDKVVIVVAPENFMIVTLYSSTEEYQRDADNQTTIAPSAKQIVSDLVSAQMKNIKSEHYKRLAQLYEDYFIKMDKLSKTTQKIVFDQSETELKALKRSIEQVESEYSHLESSLNFYIQGG